MTIGAFDGLINTCDIERSRMHQEQLDLRYREVENLSKRNNQLQDQWTRLDIECNRLSEDLQVATGRIEQLRNENANLRAEKDIWQVRFDIQTKRLGY